MTLSPDTNESVENGQAAAAPGAGQTNTTENAATIDVQAQINEALAKQQADFIAELEQATGHKDIKSLADANLKAQGEWQSRADAYKGKFEQTQIHFSIMAASAEAVSPDFVKDYLAGKAVCDEEGNVTIDGHTVADTVKNLFDKYPFLAKAHGFPGSGAPTFAPVPTVKNTNRYDFERMPPSERSRFLSSGGKVTD